MRKNHRTVLVVMALAALTAGCGGHSALAPRFQPQVVNTPNVVFSFQATGLSDVSDALTYNWSASSGHVIIHPATTTAAGSIALTVKDASGAVVYSGPIPASGDITPPSGVGGAWSVAISLASYSGTINFAIQMQ